MKIIKKKYLFKWILVKRAPTLTWKVYVLSLIKGVANCPKQRVDTYLISKLDGWPRNLFFNWPQESISHIIYTVIKLPVNYPEFILPQEGQWLINHPFIPLGGYSSKVKKREVEFISCWDAIVMKWTSWVNCDIAWQVIYQPTESDLLTALNSNQLYFLLFL